MSTYAFAFYPFLSPCQLNTLSRLPFIALFDILYGFLRVV